MNSSFNLYPILTDDQILKDVPSPAEFDFSYSENGEDRSLRLENKTDNERYYTAELRDPKCEWDPETHDLLLQCTVSISNPSSWFGVGGVVPENAIVGIAVQWISVKSEMRGIIPIGEIRVSEKGRVLSAEYTFRQNTIKGSLQLKTIVYLKEAGERKAEEQYFCSQTGTILGEISGCEVFIDGNGSVFPIATINDPNQPLWLVYFDDFADPLQDAFDKEHVEIRLNQAHPCYDQLKIESSLKESPLFLEVISSALMIIIDSAKELLGPEWDNVINGQSSFEHGSIAEAVYYFVSKLGWDTSSPSKLARSIHSFFDSNLQGGAL